MKFLYDKNAGEERLKIVNEAFLHLKARRVETGERISVRNLQDGKEYIYEIDEVERRSANLSLVFASLNCEHKFDFTIAWAVVDPKTIEKALPFLNELGVGKIAFVYTKFSQANFKIDLEKLNYINALSCEQCGRTSLMEFEIYKNLDELMNVYKNVSAINFGGKNLNEKRDDEILIIGPEGGFSEDETAKFKNIYGLNTKNILRSQTAVISVAAKFLA